MTVAISLDTMTTEEKILTMELIWDDLISKATTLDSPNWHQSILESREQAVQQGLEVPLDWTAAKKELRRKLHEN